MTMRMRMTMPMTMMMMMMMMMMMVVMMMMMMTKCTLLLQGLEIKAIPAERQDVSTEGLASVLS